MTVEIDLSEVLSSEIQKYWRFETCGQPRVQSALKILTEPVSVRAILNGADGVLENLFGGSVPLEQRVSAWTLPWEELIYFWTTFLNERFLDTPLWDPPDPEADALVIAERIAGKLFVSSRTATRYKSFLRNGAPPGVQELPQWTRAERTSGFHLSWDATRTSNQSKRFEAFRHQQVVEFRTRRQSLRSQNGTQSSDNREPGLFV